MASFSVETHIKDSFCSLITDTIQHKNHKANPNVSFVMYFINCKDNSQLLVEHNLDEDAFKQLWFKIKIKMGMDPLGPGSGLDTATLKDMKIGSIVLPCTFECEHNDMKLNLSVTRQ